MVSFDCVNIFDVDGFVRLARRLAVSGNLGVWFDVADVEKRCGLFVVDASRLLLLPATMPHNVKTSFSSVCQKRCNWGYLHVGKVSVGRNRE